MERLLSSIIALLLAPPILVSLLLLQQQAPLLMGVVVAAQTNELKAGPGSTMTPAPQNLIRSSSGVFAFGFCSFDPSDVDPNDRQFILAIWFDLNTRDCANKPVVWFARNDEKEVVIAKEQYVLSFPGSNPLSILDDHRDAVWTPTNDYSSDSTLVLQDSGNLQLFGVTGGVVDVLWESFSDPTDTLLPGNNMTNHTDNTVNLQSRKSYTNFTSGRFILLVQNDSNVVAYLVAQESGTSYAYWATGTDYQGACVTTLFFNESAIYYNFTGNCIYSNLTNHIVVQLEPNYTEGYYKYMALDPDGTVRVYVHRKNNQNGSLWDTSARLFPNNSIFNGCTRRDICGLNSYCNISNDIHQYVSCWCPDSYEFLDVQDNYMGCTPKFIPHICDGKDHSGEFKTVEMQTTSWSTESTYKTHKLAPGGSSQECVTSCLHNCLCVAVLIDDNNCMEVWTLTAGRQESGITMKALIKVRQSEPVVVLQGQSVSLLGTTLLYITVGVLATVSVASIVYNIWQSYMTKKKAKMSMLSGLRSFTYKEIKQATGGFKELLGKGSFGHVFKGELSHLEPPYVAVKRLIRSDEFEERDFDNEVQSVGQIHHKNLARLIGYCKQGVHRMLVFQYMQGGTLADFIFRSSERPRWSCLAEAAVGIARGLEYLHEGCKCQIIHCDIKPENILFDDIHTPKITDFGIAKLLGDQKTQYTVTRIAGTRPYVAPEWFDGGGKVDNKVDVYSFGVMLLEMICCKSAAGVQQQLLPNPNDDDSKDHSSSITVSVSASALSLIDWAESLLRSGRADLLVEGESEALADTKSVERFTRVAIWCLQKEPSARPRMRKVVQMLEGTMEVDPLPADLPRPPSFSAILPSGGGGGSLSSSTTVGALEID